LNKTTVDVIRCETNTVTSLSAQ